MNEHGEPWQPDPVVVGLRVRDRRRELALTQEWVAEQCVAERSTIVSIEAGRLLPSALLMARLTDALNTTTRYLLGLPEPTPAPQPGRLYTMEDATILGRRALCEGENSNGHELGVKFEHVIRNPNGTIAHVSYGCRICDVQVALTYPPLPGGGDA